MRQRQKPFSNYQDSGFISYVLLLLFIGCMLGWGLIQHMLVQAGILHSEEEAFKILTYRAEGAIAWVTESERKGRWSKKDFHWQTIEETEAYIVRGRLYKQDTAQHKFIIGAYDKIKNLMVVREVTLNLNDTSVPKTVTIGKVYPWVSADIEDRGGNDPLYPFTE